MKSTELSGEWKNPYWILLLFLIINLFLKCFNLSLQSFWIDELATIHFAVGKSPIQFLIHYWQTPDFHPPFYYFIVNLISQITQVNEFSLRYFSAIISSLTILPLYQIAIRFSHSRFTAMVVVAFFTFSGANLYYAQEARSYALMLFLGLMTYNYLLDFSEENLKKWLIVKYLFAGTFFFYTSYVAIPFLLLVLFQQLLYRKIPKSNLKPLLISTIAIFILFIPWLPVLISQLGQWSIYKPYNAIPNILTYFEKMVSFSFAYTPYWSMPSELIDVGHVQKTGLLLFLVTIAIGTYYQFKKIKSLPSPNFLPLQIVMIVIFLVFLKDFFSEKKFFYERNLLLLTPFFYLSFALSLEAIKFKFLRYALVSISIMICLFQPILNQNFFDTTYKTEHRSISQKIINYYQSANTNLFYACGETYYFDYYLKGDGEIPLYDGREEHLIRKKINSSQKDQFALIFEGCYFDLKMISNLNRDYKQVQSISENTQAGMIIYQVKK